MHDEQNDRNANTLFTELTTAAHLVQQLSNAAGQLKRQSDSIIAGFRYTLELNAGTREYSESLNTIALFTTRLGSAASSLIELRAALQRLSPGFRSQLSLSIPTTEPSSSKPAIGPLTATAGTSPLLETLADSSSKHTTRSIFSSNPHRSPRQRKSRKRLR